MERNFGETAAVSERPAAELPRRILPGTTVGGEAGTFSVDFVLWNGDKTESRSLNGLVDTGASYSLAPASILEELGVIREQTVRFVMANGARSDMSIGWVTMELTGQTRNVYIVFGPENAGVLLGAMALESFGVAADAKHRRLIPAELTL